MDKSSGKKRPIRKHTYCTIMAKISSLTTTAVGDSGDSNSSCIGLNVFFYRDKSSIQYSGLMGILCCISAK